MIDFISVVHHTSDLGGHLVKKSNESFSFLVTLCSLKTPWAALELLGDLCSIAAGEEIRQNGSWLTFAFMIVGATISMWPFAAMMEQTSFSIGTKGTWLVWFVFHLVGIAASFFSVLSQTQ